MHRQMNGPGRLLPEWHAAGLGFIDLTSDSVLTKQLFQTPMLLHPQDGSSVTLKRAH